MSEPSAAGAAKCVRSLSLSDMGWLRGLSTTSSGDGAGSMSDVIPTLIQEVAALQEELELNCKPLQARLERARSLLKDALTEAGRVEVIDETSGYRALMKDTHIDRKSVV